MLGLSGFGVQSVGFNILAIALRTLGLGSAVGFRVGQILKLKSPGSDLTSLDPMHIGEEIPENQNGRKLEPTLNP